MVHPNFKPRDIPCLVPSCTSMFLTLGGRTQHINAAHRNMDSSPSPVLEQRPLTPDIPQSPAFDFQAGSPVPDNLPVDDPNIDTHPWLTGSPCDKDGNFLAPNGAPSLLDDPPAHGDYAPYESRAHFQLAELLYHRNQMPGTQIDKLFQVWSALHPDSDPPFHTKDDLYQTIDNTTAGNIPPWQSFTLSYPCDEGENDPSAPWKLKEYEVFFRDPRKIIHSQLANPDFKDEMDFTLKRVFDKDDKPVYKDFMSEKWAWRQADKIAEDPSLHGAVFCLLISGSDKTTVSVATGQNDYYPFYMSNGLVHNNVRRAHREAVSLVAFFAIPKNGHFRQTVYGIGPYIADYPEQVLLSCIVQGWCPRCTARHDDLDGPGGRRSHEHTESLYEALGARSLWDEYGVIDGIMSFTYGFPQADIHELMLPDILHQMIKGTFKDHLVTWIQEYLESVHDAKEAKRIMADIDQRIAAVPAFPGLRRFPEGRGFKQWTGDDSKALMKVYLPAISGHVPPGMVQAIAHFLEFCYLIRRDTIDAAALDEIDRQVALYHQERQIFITSGVQPKGISLPRQHSMVHYRVLIEDFAAPNGLCSSITESKHIKAVKEPWRRSSHYEALSQMLLINQRNDKLQASRVDFAARGMLSGSLFSIPPPPPDATSMALDEKEDSGAASVRNIPRKLEYLAEVVEQLRLPELARRFLHAQLHPEDDCDISDDDLPQIDGTVHVFTSAVATFFAPSDESGLGGMHHERIRSTAVWRKASARRDCIFVEHDPDLPGFQGLLAARVLLFFSFKHNNVVYPCAMVRWYSVIGEGPDDKTGLWIVKPDRGDDGLDVIHCDAILRGAHLIGRAGSSFIPRLNFTDSLDAFQLFYVNKYADHHAHEIAF
ncbi:hypothetical protein C8J56DRAFT_1009909 [Mycena floridula]|nr:hypothetical protein C8J56DRAFT_1009909 [Mycena floridula]